MKPDPPENVVARPVPSSPRRLEVTWQTPSTWPDPESFPLKFFLRYRPLILDQWQHVSTLPRPDPWGLSCARGTVREETVPQVGLAPTGDQWQSERLIRDPVGLGNGWSPGRHPHQNMSRTPRAVERSAGQGTGLAGFPTQYPPLPALSRRGAVLDPKNRMVPPLRDLPMGPRG